METNLLSVDTTPSSKTLSTPPSVLIQFVGDGIRFYLSCSDAGQEDLIHKARIIEQALRENDGKSI